MPVRDLTLARWLGGTLTAALIGLATILSLQEPASQKELWLEMGRGLIQLALIGVLGTVLKVVADSHQEARSLRQRREEFRAEKLRQLVQATNTLRKARKLIEANRSVATWDAQMVAVIDAGLELRVLKHQILESAGAPNPPFPDAIGRELAEHVDAMAGYIDWLTADFSAFKQQLGEDQRSAEGKPATEDRTVLLQRIWNTIQSLPSMADLLADPEHAQVRPSSWTSYRHHYDAALGLMTRLSLDPVARTYLDARKRSTPGWRRTMELERIVGEARRQAAQTPHEPSDIEALYRRGDDGQRVCALVIAQEFPSESLDGIVRDAIANSRSAFEQYHAVAAASRLVPQLDPPRRREFADFLRKQLSDNKHLKGSSDRKRFVDWLVAELAEHSEARSF